MPLLNDPLLDPEQVRTGKVSSIAENLAEIGEEKVMPAAKHLTLDTVDFNNRAQVNAFLEQVMDEGMRRVRAEGAALRAKGADGCRRQTACRRITSRYEWLQSALNWTVLCIQQTILSANAGFLPLIPSTTRVPL